MADASPAGGSGGSGGGSPPHDTLQARRQESMHKKRGSWVGSLVKKDAAAMERKARKKAGKQERKQEKKVRKLQKKEAKAEAKGHERSHEAEAQAQRTAFDQFIIAHRPTRRPGTHWEYLDIKSATTPADAEPVVFLPPGALRPEAFFDLLTRLSAKHRVMAVVFPADFSALADYVAGVELILSHASISKAHFFGVGFGAFVAHQLLSQRPGIFSSLTLAFASPPDPELGKLIRRYARTEHVERTPELFPYFAGFGEKLRDEPEVRDMSEVDLEFWQHVMKNFGVGKKRAEELLPRFEACATHHLEARIEAEQLKAQAPRLPVLVLDSDAGERAAVARSFLKLHPDAQIHLMRDASHLQLVLRGRAVAEKVESFYASQAAPAIVIVPAELSVPTAVVHSEEKGKEAKEEDKKKEKKRSNRTKDARPS